MRVGDQIAEVIRADGELDSAELRQETKRILSDVRFANPERIYRAFRTS